MKWCAAALLALPLHAHMVSMSSGTLRVEGASLIYEARIPLYEIPNIANFDKSLFDEVHFRAKSGEARAIKTSCAADKAEGFYRCDGTYLLARPEEEVEAYVGWHRVISQNHVHVLSAIRGENTAHAVLQASTPSAPLRFRPLTAAEQVAEAVAAGVQWLLTTPVMLLLLVSIVVASRTAKEFAVLAASFFLGQLVPLLNLTIAGKFNPKFLELASALAVAYLAVEILFLPKSGTRWLVVSIVGLFPGLALAAMVQQTELSAMGVWFGTMLTETALAALVGFMWLRTSHKWERPMGWLLLLLGAAWFAFRWFV